MDSGEDYKRKAITRKKSSYRISLSASLPEDVCGAFSGDTICAVKLSKDPFSDMRASILEMIQNVGVHDWDEMEELVYCYIALNSPDLHGIIANAFLSLSCHFS